MSTNPKEIIFDEEARSALKSGIQQLADVIAFTLGPRGRNVALEKSWGPPAITNDGNNIIKDLVLKNECENMGVAIAKEVVEKIKENCGDGTTTGTLMLNALVDNGIKHIASGISPIALKRGIEKASEAIIAELEKRATPIKNAQETADIAIASANGNKQIGQTIADAIAKVGQTGVVSIEEGKGTETTIEIVEGMQIDRGFLSPYFVTNVDKMQAEIANPKILLVENKISSIHELLPLLQTVAQTGAELLIIAEDIEGDALSTLVVNKLRGTLKVCAIKAPGFGDRKKAMLQDLAVLTGATVVSEETGVSLKELPPEMLGSAEKVTVTKESTTIINGSGSEEAIQARVIQIENECAAANSSYDQEKLKERKAKLKGGVAVIRVGAATEPEMKQAKQDHEDSLNSTLAALEQGIVPGGGVALLRSSIAVAESLKLEGEEAAGAEIVFKACQMPLKQIAKNSGCDGARILAEVISASSDSVGFNALTENVEDLNAAGVRDPAKVVISILRHAASGAGIVLISEALITDAPEDNKEEKSQSA